MIAYSSLKDLLNHVLLHRWFYTHLWCFHCALELGIVEGKLKGRFISLYRWWWFWQQKSVTGGTLIQVLSGTSELTISSEESRRIIAGLSNLSSISSMHV